MEINIIVSGVNGKMGREVVKMIVKDPNLSLVCGVSRTFADKTVGDVVGDTKVKAPCVGSVKEALQNYKADILIDFTSPYAVKKHMMMAIEAGVRPIIGTTGFSKAELKQFSELCKERKLGGIIAPNFAIGAILMMLFAAKASQYLPNIEIIELHNDQKVDAPSGTAVKTVELISGSHNCMSLKEDSTESFNDARGANHLGYRIHSVRLPGLIAHQEVLLSDEGQLLSIRHECFDREAFMPGLKLAINEVMQLKELVYGLEKLINV